MLCRVLLWEEESQDLKLSWYNDTSQFMFEVEWLEIEPSEEVKVDMEDILSLCNQPKAIIIQGAKYIACYYSCKKKQKRS
ncbi:hypothetical protein RDI58_022434 [Solanum bulbocastanum]|uniref:Uncharacterized protein n=1 Tax=Solanum bulbocastanum TaxID=147425 RepID=A0AAN8Y583_SOLBU